MLRQIITYRLSFRAAFEPCHVNLPLLNWVSEYSGPTGNQSTGIHLPKTSRKPLVPDVFATVLRIDRYGR
jgi:hypothetical protein